VRNHCDVALNAAGHCPGVVCTNPPPVNVGRRFIRGRDATAGGANTYAIFLDSSPNAIVEEVGATPAGCGAVTSTGNAAALRIRGDATGTLVRASNLTAFAGGGLTEGIWMEPCGGASPWIFDNERISGSTTVTNGKGDGIRATGDCHPRIDSNVQIIGGLEGANTDTNGVYCTRDATSKVSSRCTILNNTAIVGSNSGFPPNSAGVRCDDGACARIDGNAINGRAGINSFGILLGNTGPVIQRNLIDAGCPTKEGVGIEADGSFARIQNNVVRGVTLASCGVGAVVTPNSWALRALNSAGSNELDVHSNDLLAYGVNGGTTMCRAISIGNGASAPTTPLGIYRNNILHAGFCPTAYGVDETSTSADPRIFENNDIFTAGNASANVFLYRDEASTNLTTIAAVNALSGFQANLSADPLFVAPSPFSASTAAANYHLQSPASVCIDAGTANGTANLGNDFYGTARPQRGGYDIGAAEEP
jgi:hypothetical protein